MYITKDYISSRNSPKEVVEPTLNRQAMRDVRACTSEKSGRGVSGPYLKDMVWKIAAREEQN